MQERTPAFDVQIGLELNKAIVARNGDAAVLAFADIVRTQRLVISQEAWAYLDSVVGLQRHSVGATDADF